VNRASAVLELKAFDDAQRTIEGIATTPTPDRGGDILEPAGAQFTLPMPLLWQHDQKQPIGEVIEARVTSSGIFIKAKLAQIDEPGSLKDRLDEAYQAIKARLVRGLSVGWTPIDMLPIKGSFGMRAVKWAWAELSAVTIPQNVEAAILTVKSSAVPARKDRPMTTAERIAALENSRAAKVGRLSTLMEKATADNVTLAGGPDAEEYDGLEVDVKNLDADLTRLRTLESLNKAAATPVPATLPIERPYSQVQIKSNVAPGTAFFRYCQAKAAGRGDSNREIAWAAQWRDSTPEVELCLKAAVAAGNSTDATWAGPLAALQPLASEFLELLRPATYLGKIPGFRKVPFNVSVPSQTGGGTYSWVGEGAPKPVTKAQFGSISLLITKCAGIIVITEELARSSSPDAISVLQREMIAGISQFLDVQFIDPTVAAVAGVSPASVTNGVTPITSAGTSPANARTDVTALIAAMTTAGITTAGAALIMSESNAAALGAALNPLGQALFPNMSSTGGTAMGIRVFASQSAGSNVVLVQPDCILYADDGGVTIDISREASVQMDSAPMNPPDATVVLRSLWQTNSVGLRAERFINWKKARTGSVQYTVQTYVA
jgi:HK97 family phage major capsid protein/HK97 family phage prohead protease